MKKTFIFLFIIFVMFASGCVINKPTLSTGDKNPSETQYTYNAFTVDEKAIFINLIGEEIPFLPNNEYCVESEDSIVRFYTIGNTDEDFTKYQKSIINFGYKYVSWSLEEGHGYEKGNIELFLKDYTKEEKNYIEVNVWLKGNSNNPGGGNTETPGGTETTSTIAALLKEAESLAPNASLSGDRTITAQVGEIDEPYTDEFKNISFYLTDGEYSILVHRGKGDGIENLKTGDTVTVTGTVTNYQPKDSTDTIIEFVKPTITVSGSGSGDSGNQGGTETTSTIAALLKEAESLAPNASLSGDRTITAQVGEIDEPYTDEFKNISFYLTDGEYSILVHRGKGDGIENLKTGDTVTVTGTVTNYQFTNSTDTIIEFAKPAITVVSTSGSGDSGNQGGGNTDNPGTGYLYNDFSSDDKALFNEHFGFVIPFLPNNEYYVEEYTSAYDDGSYEDGVNFYIYGCSKSEFDTYLNKIANLYTTDGTDVYDGVTWYLYSKDDVYLDLAFYNDGEDDLIDVYVYYLTEGSDDGNQGGSDNENVEIITNDGKGLPTDTDGVYDIDFTNAEYVKNVAQQGNYLDGCPTSGDVKVLVIPVEFSDVTAASKGYDLNKLKLAFNGSGNDTDYRSVKEYYFESSYEQLKLDFVVLDSWFRPNNTSSYYANLTMEYYGSEALIGDQVIMDEALAYLESRMDLSDFDSDNNSVIDAVVMINTLEIDQTSTFNWAYRYWNIYTDNEGYYYEYDGVSANDYLWASYKFLYEGTYGEYTDTSAMNTYTYIHEFGHVLGVDDYYDYSDYRNDPLDGKDIMDNSLGDHNPFSKINLGWLTTSRLVVANNSITLTLEDFSKNGDTIIIANNWDSKLGAYQEYYILMYYKHTGLNDDGHYFDQEGVVMYHVNASLKVYEEGGKTYYDIYNSNSDASYEYGTENNLIELCKSSTNSYVHTVGSNSSSNLVDDLGNTISYTFTVDSLNSESATITFSKNN